MVDIDRAEMKKHTLHVEHPVWADAKDFLHEYSLSYELPKVKDTFTQKVTGDYDVSHLKSDSQEYHESGFIERYPVDVTKLKKSEPKLYEEGKVNEENMEYLKKLITFCKENDIEFVAVTTPIPINTLKDYSDSYNAAWKYFGQFFEEQELGLHRHRSVPDLPAR